MQYYLPAISNSCGCLFESSEQLEHFLQSDEELRYFSTLRPWRAKNHRNHRRIRSAVGIILKREARNDTIHKIITKEINSIKYSESIDSLFEILNARLIANVENEIHILGE